MNINLQTCIFNRLWFLRPIRDIDVIKQRQDAVAFFVNPRNIEVFSTLTDCMKNIKNIVVRVCVYEQPRKSNPRFSVFGMHEFIIKVIILHKKERDFFL